MSFKVRTDEEFYNKFKELELKLRQISSNFQNPNRIASHEHWEGYISDVSDFRESFDKLIYEADSRFELL